MNTSINSVEFENSDNIIYLGKGAFYNCSNLTNITIPNNIKSIRYCTFEECINLSTVILPDIVRIETSAFYNCQSLTGITIPDGVKRIGNSVFYNCQNIGDVEIPTSVEQIDAYAFNMCWYNNTGVVTPDVVMIDINCAVGYIFKNLCAIDEFLHHRLGTFVGFFDQTIDNSIGAGVRPVRFIGNHVVLQESSTRCPLTA